MLYVSGNEGISYGGVELLAGLALIAILLNYQWVLIALLAIWRGEDVDLTELVSLNQAEVRAREREWTGELQGDSDTDSNSSSNKESLDDVYER